MYILFGLNILIAILLYFYLKNRALHLYMPISMMTITLVDYPLIGSGNFINSFFIVSVCTIAAIYYFLSKKAAFAVKHPKEIILLTLLMIPLIPLLLATSIRTTYLASAYLSVSVFIIGAIIFIFGIIDYHMVTKGIYKYIKYPVLIGQLLMYATFTIMTLFMPYFFCYLIWFILFATHLIKESRP